MKLTKCMMSFFILCRFADNYEKPYAAQKQNQTLDKKACLVAFNDITEEQEGYHDDAHDHK